MTKHLLQCFALLSVLAGLVGNAAAQGRISDKDVEKLMNNLKEDSKKFSSSFKNDVSKSTFHKTSQEKTAKQLADTFPKQVEGMLNQFKSKKNANAAIPAVYQSYRQLGEFLGKMSPSKNTTASWARVKSEMDQITTALSYSPPA